jgi:tripartite-type tricarboxylate transporter receptor subunit TctC
MTGGQNMKEHAWKYLLCATVLFVLVVSPCLAAEDPAKFPSKPITMIITFGVGGDLDLTNRMIVELGSKYLGQKIVCENKPGGGGGLASTMLAKAAPDGYTIGTASYGPIVFRPIIWGADYKPKEDFTFLTGYGEFQHGFVVQAESPYKTFKDFVEEARKNPGYMTYTTPGHLTGQHVFMEQVFAQEKVKVTHVPVKGGQEPNIMLLGGHIDGALDSDVLSSVLDGKMRLLASQSFKRNPLFPDVPTFYELGYNYEPVLWLGILGPKGMDPRIVKKFEDAFRKAFEDPAYKKLAKDLRVSEVYRNSKEFTEKINRDIDFQTKALQDIKKKMLGE